MKYYNTVIHSLDFDENVILLYQSFILLLFSRSTERFDIVKVEILVENMKMYSIRGTAFLLICKLFVQ